MKKIIITFLFSAGLLVSCTELEVTPTSFVTEDNYFITQDDAVASVTAVYASLSIDPGEQSLFGRNLYFLTDMGSDYAAAGVSATNPQVRAMSSLTHDATNDRVQVAWRQIYNGINRANVSIDNIPKVAGNEVIKTRLINEAKFIRGLLYFQAVRLWGGVPIVLHEAKSINLGDLKTNRATVEEVYTQIIQDLTDAEALPPTYTAADAGRATSGAAKAILAKVYLTRKDWPNAILKAREVINGGYGYALFEDFQDIFTKTKKNGKEHIFSVQFEPNQAGNGSSGSTFQSTSFTGFTATEPADIISDVALFYDIYAPGDKRRDVSYAKQLLNPTTGTLYTFPKPIFKKYLDLTNLATPGNVAINFPIIRYADILLSLAEAINEQSGPTAETYELINQVRRRAFGKPITTPDAAVDLAGLNQTTFRAAIQEERKKEFVQEGQRWFDLVRWGTLVTEVKKVTAKNSVSERNNLYPIPQSERNINPDGLPQNPGY
ncbi:MULTISPECIES: RagB/SusD family nutrient uptake outer membrane protein [unclassified Flavobacterium]|uniref:RagB/SusD family nutrient uptake outer membrane protein n=1 Tax=unclassified Flavobacterium TaxID=196869 RepID=UPI00070953C4|nr:MULTISPECIES: RagB/SusD family nutrient uptake outer membrane protein [unclassified Flavobacterium]KRD61578.1 carbohydrate-binding protein SusD [Flavobacterium sp. Root935]TDX12553.1 putative outer membrane starch-binding protein [Flavobacterium sp. S87F.05.LMB.W.Kidney.N]BDU27267.1 membrane protein [Flavobacterium sp. GSB-24]